jgi:hypothetical protein
VASRHRQFPRWVPIPASPAENKEKTPWLIQQCAIGRGLASTQPILAPFETARTADHSHLSSAATTHTAWGRCRMHAAVGGVKVAWVTTARVSPVRLLARRAGSHVCARRGRS